MNNVDAVDFFIVSVALVLVLVASVPLVLIITAVGCN